MVRNKTIYEKIARELVVRGYEKKQSVVQSIRKRSRNSIYGRF